MLPSNLGISSFFSLHTSPRDSTEVDVEGHTLSSSHRHWQANRKASTKCLLHFSAKIWWAISLAFSLWNISLYLAL